MMQSTDTITVLHVDDEPGFAAAVADHLERADERFAVTTGTRAEEWVGRLADAGIDCVVSEYDLPGIDGVAFLRAVREDHPALPFVICTDAGSEAVASEAIAAGVTDYVPKRMGGDGDGDSGDGNGVAGEPTDAARGDVHAAVAERIRRTVAPTGVDTSDPGQALRWSNARFERLLDTSPVGITLLDTGGNIVRANHRAERVLGLDASDITDRTYDDPAWHIVDEDGDPIPEADLSFARVLDTGEPVFEYEHGIRWPDGTERWLSVNAAPLRSPAGDVEQVVAVITDVTDRREYERRIERTNEQLEAFASVVSHDLRNPLNVAQGRLELAGEECDSEHLAPAARAIDRCLDLVADLLALAREGDDVDEFETVSLGDLATACWETVATDGARLVVDSTATVRADRSRLRQLLENLFRNSVEHGSTCSRPEADDSEASETPRADGEAVDSVEHGSTGNRSETGDSVEHGGEAVTVTVGDLEDGFYVADDGVGVPPADREAVFRSGYSTAADGTGFGPAIVRQVAEAHGWTVSLDGSDGGGARFEFRGVGIVESGQRAE